MGSIDKRLKIGDYVCFNDDLNVIFKVVDIDDNMSAEHSYILYYDPDAKTLLWERFDCVTKIIKVNEVIDIKKGR